MEEMKTGIRMMISVLLIGLFANAQAATAEDIAFNFKNADIRAFIEYVAGFSDKNFLIDNRVKGKVTIISPAPVPEDQAYDIFLSVLEVNGFAAVKSGSVIKIIPRAEGKQKGAEVVTASRGNDALVSQVIKLKHANAQELVSLLKPLISPNSHLVAYPRGNMLLLTDSGSNAKRILQIVRIVDRKDAVGVKIFTLKYASADKLSKTITSLYAGAQGKSIGTQVKAISYQSGNMMIVVAPAQVIREIESMVVNLDVKPEADNGRLQVRYLKHASAEGVAKVLSELLGQAGMQKSGGRGKALFSGDVKVVADPATNAILITADPSDMQAVNHIVDKLDIRRLQVLVEALIVEVTGNSGEQFGVEWLVNSEFNQGRNTVVGGQNFTGLSQTITGGGTGANLAGNIASSLPQGLTIGILRGSLANGSVSLAAVLHAIETEGDANVLSTPNVIAMDNEEAEFVVGQNVPFLTGQNATQGGTANPFQTIERKDIGLTLKVTPQISEGNTIRLEIYQEVSSISSDATLDGAASDLITNKRSVRTVALAQDGQILVLGGLMREDGFTTVKRVPCIGSVPVLGEPFTFTENSRRKTNLMVFIRPRIIRSEQDMKTITQEKYLDIKSFYESSSVQGSIFFPREKTKLPDDMQPANQAESLELKSKNIPAPESEGN